MLPMVFPTKCPTSVRRCPQNALAEACYWVHYLAQKAARLTLVNGMTLELGRLFVLLDRITSGVSATQDQNENPITDLSLES